MTMGALHDGHDALIRAAQARAEHVLVTIFVNPLQFGPNEDYERYPRPYDDDLGRLSGLGVDVVFAPSVDVMYPGYPEAAPPVRVNPGPRAGTPVTGRRSSRARAGPGSSTAY